MSMAPELRVVAVKQQEDAICCCTATDTAHPSNAIHRIISPTKAPQTVEQSPPNTLRDDDVLAYMNRQLRSGRVKPSVLVSLTQKAFADISHERIVQCFNQLDCALLKR